MDMIYFDHAATTRVLPEAAQAAVEAMTVAYGNPSSLVCPWGPRRPRRWRSTGRRWRRRWAAGRRSCVYLLRDRGGQLGGAAGGPSGAAQGEAHHHHRRGALRRAGAVQGAGDAGV